MNICTRNTNYFMDELFSGLNSGAKDEIIEVMLRYIDVVGQLIVIATHELIGFEMMIDEWIVPSNGERLE